MAVAFFARVQKGASTSLSVREEREREKERKKERERCKCCRVGFLCTGHGICSGNKAWAARSGDTPIRLDTVHTQEERKEKKRKNTHNHDNNNNNNNNKSKQIDASYTRTTDQRGVDAHRNTNT